MTAVVDPEEVRRHWQSFRGDWDFERDGALRLDLRARPTLLDQPSVDAPAKAADIRVFEVRLETGTIKGRLARRLVAYAPGLGESGLTLDMEVR